MTLPFEELVAELCAGCACSDLVQRLYCVFKASSVTCFLARGNEKQAREVVMPSRGCLPVSVNPCSADSGNVCQYVVDAWPVKK